jgi:hypothetical protein
MSTHVEVRMSRLYYETDPAFTVPKDALRLETGSDTEASAKSYLEKVAKLVPNEVIIGYLTIIGFVPVIRLLRLQGWFYWGTFALALVLTPIYLIPLRR